MPIHAIWCHLRAVSTAFDWDDRVFEGWGSVRDWHNKVLASGAIRTPSDADAAVDLATRANMLWKEQLAQNMLFYEAMRDIAHTQAHQK
ncbi:MAG: hypothetical protein AAF674_17060 [Pseudomonadota bacterium]